VRHTAYWDQTLGVWPTGNLRGHASAALVPSMSVVEAAALQADIAARGIQVPIEITAAGVVLDGRQRHRAALALKLAEVPVRVVAPADPVEYMLAAAIQRRNLTASQKATLALELDGYRETKEHAAARKRANLRNGVVDVAAVPHRAGRSRDHAAELAGVSPRLIQHAITVRDNDPHLFEQAKRGEVTLPRAAQEIQRRRNHQAVGSAGKLPRGRFQVIYADPPWQLGNPESKWSPEQHYPTLPTATIKELPVPAATDAVLFLWAVSSLLPDALEVLSAWGFTYKTTLVWVKPSIGLGAWVRHRHELLLIGQRGTHPAPTPRRRPDSVLEAPRGRHSEKPAHTHTLIERMYPNARRLELFARGAPRTGWTAWGNEVKAP
jgi:N6-adenosine-specific RNA methylase IME4